MPKRKNAIDVVDSFEAFYLGDRAPTVQRPTAHFVAPLAGTPKSLTRHRNFSHAPMSWKGWEGGHTAEARWSADWATNRPPWKSLLRGHGLPTAQAGDEEPCRGLGQLSRWQRAGPETPATQVILFSSVSVCRTEKEISPPTYQLCPANQKWHNKISIRCRLRTLPTMTKMQNCSQQFS